MDIEQARHYCLSLKGTEEGTPFGPETLVFKVGGKIFAIMGLDSLDPAINLKCDPDRAIELREKYSEITPGYHMNKMHWNTVLLEGNVQDTEIKSLIDHSYDLIYSKLSEKVKAEIANLI